MNITVIGTGFVGVVTAAVLASFEHSVVGLDIDQDKVEKLKKGNVPFYEPGLKELLQKAIKHGNLDFTTSYQKAVSDADVVMVAVGTPSAPDGTADLTYVFSACESMAPHLKNGAVVCIKSTVPPGIFTQIKQKMTAITGTDFSLASLPEFLREGSAVEDTLHPDRVVIGSEDARGSKILTDLHQPFNAPIIVVSPESAQMGKYAANAYLATRITFINQIADLCESNGADVQEVIQVIGEDERIGKHYWYPGLGYGGSCFPKDVRELAAYSRSIGHGNNLFNRVNELNAERIFVKLDEFEREVGGWSDKKVAVLGLSFKPNTDDLREAPSTKIIPHLLHKGARIIAHDPMALTVAKQIIPPSSDLEFADSIDKTIKDADIVLLLVEWPEYTTYPFTDTAGDGRYIIDTRNQLDKVALRKAGWKYLSVGRKVSK